MFITVGKVLEEDAEKKAVGTYFLDYLFEKMKQYFMI